MLVSSFHDNKTQIYYKKSCDYDNDDNAKGMRVKITFTFTGEGKVFRPYVTVSGLTERGLPSKECFSGIFLFQYQVYPWKGTGIQLVRRVDVSYF